MRRALEAEAMGKPDDRAARLREALEVDADYAPAHWHSGEVRVGDRWFSVDEAAQERTRSGKVAEYRKFRDKAQRSVPAQLRVARFCRDAGLKDQERVHLYFAYLLDPDSPPKQLIDNLGLVPYAGLLLPREQVEAIRDNESRAQKTADVWLPRLSQWATAAAVDENSRAAVIEQISSIDDPDTIPALEAVFATAPAQLGVAVIESLKGMSGQAATDSLLRYALFSPELDVRDAAAEGLKERSPFSYMPVLMGALESPVQVRLESTVLAGQVGHMLTLFQEGPFHVRSAVSSGAASISRSTLISALHGTSTTVRYTPDQSLYSDYLLASAADAHNNRVGPMNERVIEILRTTTGLRLGPDPNPWWDYWYDYNEIYRPPQKYVSRSVQTFVPPPGGDSVVRCISCFVAGTPVWTMTGPMAIERVPIGECILTQNPATGEVAYKPVMAKTIRPASPVIAVGAGGKTINVTRGHPFWVSGKGWRMAKELAVGDWLHTVDGPIEIQSGMLAGNAVCHNLVVADFSTYFVGDRKVLVHDNNIRDATQAVVPGLVER
ncbi:MAG: HEAT repeat domain-containing protein [Planctomycetia bacterium]|nr:HEAT repeat domain-containing protein [Planctomycetia bacterium]